MQFDIVSFALVREDLLLTLKWVEGAEKDEKAMEFEPRTEDEIGLVSSIKVRLLRLKEMIVDYASKVNNATLFPSEVLLTSINRLVAMISTIEENNNKYNKELYEQKCGGMDQACTYPQTPELEPCQMLILSDVSSRLKELKRTIEEDVERMSSGKSQLEGLFAYLTHLGEFIHSYVYALFTENIQSGSIFHNEQDWLIRSANGSYSTKPSTQEEISASRLENRTMSLEMVWSDIGQEIFSTSPSETNPSESGEQKEKEKEETREERTIQQSAQAPSPGEPREKKNKKMEMEMEMEMKMKMEEETERNQVKRNHSSTEEKREEGVTSVTSLRDKSPKRDIHNTIKESKEDMSVESDTTPILQKNEAEPSKEVEGKEKEEADLPKEISRKKPRRKRNASMVRSTILPSTDLKKGKKSENENESENENGENEEENEKNGEEKGKRKTGKGKGRERGEKERNGKEGEPSEEKEEKEEKNDQEEGEMSDNDDDDDDDDDDEPPRCIREGEEYQAEVKPFDPEIASTYSKKEYKQEVLWDPNRLSHSELEAFTSIFPADLWENVFEVIVKYDYNLEAAYADLVENPPVNPITKFSPEDQRRLEENTENMASLHKYFFPYVKNTDVVDLFYHMDASFQDEICPICSTDGQLIYCLKCPRGFHKNCLKINTKDFICPFCLTTRETLSGEKIKEILNKYKRHLCRAYSVYDE